jgi:uncharacterized protein with FMN-binding domain
LSTSHHPGPPPHTAHAHATRAEKRAQNRLVALGSAAILAIYFAGYVRTRSAAQRDEGPAAGRRFAGSPPAVATAPVLVAKVAVASLPLSQPATVPTPVAPPPAVAVPPVAVPPVAVAPTPVAVATTPAPVLAVVAAPVINTPNVTAPADVPAPKWKDGTFTGWGHCRHGDIEATVTIKDGRIVSSFVSTCRTRYSCDVIDAVVPQVVKRQSPDIDTVAGATQSADAYYYAVSNALATAKPESTKPL